MRFIAGDSSVLPGFWPFGSAGALRFLAAHAAMANRASARRIPGMPATPFGIITTHRMHLHVRLSPGLPHNIPAPPHRCSRLAFAHYRLPHRYFPGIACRPIVSQVRHAYWPGHLPLLGRFRGPVLYSLLYDMFPPSPGIRLCSGIIIPLPQGITHLSARPGF